MNYVSVVKIIGLVISLLLNGCTTNGVNTGDLNVSGNDLTATEVIQLMGNGINLGNTLEAYNHKSYVDSGINPTSFETLWGQPDHHKGYDRRYESYGASILSAFLWHGPMA